MYSEKTRYAPASGYGDLPPRETERCGCTGGGNGGAVLLPADMSEARLGDLPIAMAYVPPQKWREVLEPDAALREGTQFRELALHFTGSRPENGRGGGCRG